jgi:hypothetical protein
MAGYLLSHAGGDVEAQIALCYRRVLSRSPTVDEAGAARALLAGETQRLHEEGHAAEQLALPRPLAEGADPYQAAALVEFCLAMFNTNEFVYVD